MRALFDVVKDVSGRHTYTDNHPAPTHTHTPLIQGEGRERGGEGRGGEGRKGEGRRNGRRRGGGEERGGRGEWLTAVLTAEDSAITHSWQ